MDISNSFNGNVGLASKDLRKLDKKEEQAQLNNLDPLDAESQADNSRQGAGDQRVTEASASTESEKSRSPKERAKQDIARAGLRQIVGESGGQKSADPKDIAASQIARSHEETTKGTENETARDSNQKAKIEMIDL